MLTSTQMTEAEFDAKRKELGERKHAGAKWDQELAKLYARSGWTQERLANKEGMSQQHMSRWMLFGRFLEFTPIGVKPEFDTNGITEGGFRRCWSQTTGSDERRRFREVVKKLAEPVSKCIGKQISDRFGDGEWHSQDTIVEAIGPKAIDGLKSFTEGRRRHSSGVAKCETKLVGRTIHYRMFRATKSVSCIEIAVKLGPIVKALLKEGNKNATTASPPTVKHHAKLLEKLMQEWTEDETKETDDV